MEEDRGAIFCNTCEKYRICYKEEMEEYYDEFSDFCDCLDKKIFIKGNDMKDPTFFLNCIADDLESANHHGSTSLPDEIYDEIVKKLKIRKNKKLEVAKILYECFYKNI